MLPPAWMFDRATGSSIVSQKVRARKIWKYCSRLNCQPGPPKSAARHDESQFQAACAHKIIGNRMQSLGFLRTHSEMWPQGTNIWSDCMIAQDIHIIFFNTIYFRARVTRYTPPLFSHRAFIFLYFFRYGFSFPKYAAGYYGNLVAVRWYFQISSDIENTEMTRALPKFSFISFFLQAFISRAQPMMHLRSHWPRFRGKKPIFLRNDCIAGSYGRLSILSLRRFQNVHEHWLFVIDYASFKDAIILFIFWGRASRDFWVENFSETRLPGVKAPFSRLHCGARSRDIRADTLLPMKIRATARYAGESSMRARHYFPRGISTRASIVASARLFKFSTTIASISRCARSLMPMAIIDEGLFCFATHLHRLVRGWRWISAHYARWWVSNSRVECWANTALAPSLSILPRH